MPALSTTATSAEFTVRSLGRSAKAMQGNSAAFGSRLDRGWVPPTLDDIEAGESVTESGSAARDA